jgi:hypothetical protein
LERCEENLNKVCELSPPGPSRKRAEYFREVFLKRKEMVLYWFRAQAVKDYSSSGFKNKFAQNNFNQNSTGWTMWEARPDSGKCSVDNNGGLNGSKALRLDFNNSKSASDFGFEKLFEVKNPQNFELSVWCRNVETNPQTIPYISVDWLKADGKTRYRFCYNDTHGNSTRKWTKLLCRVPSPPKLPCRMRVRLLASCRGQRKGYVLFDDLVIKTDK